MEEAALFNVLATILADFGTDANNRSIYLRRR